jgi:hypothetical protein
MIIVDKISDLLYRLKDPVTGRELKSIHVDRLHKFDTARDALYQKFPALTDDDDSDSDLFVRADETPTTVTKASYMTKDAEVQVDSGQVDTGTGRRKAVKPDKHTQRVKKNVVNKSNNNSTYTKALPEGYYLVQKVLRRKKENGIEYFLVKWSDGSSSYEPRSHLTQAALDSYYLERSRKQEMQRRRKRH